MKIEVVDGVRRPRHERGCDWGVEREVLVRLMDKPGPVKELWWMGGCKYWAGRGCDPGYAPANLSLVKPGSWSALQSVGGADSVRTEIHEGRFSVRVIAQHAEKINDFFGANVAGLIQRGKTVVITKGG